MLKTAIVVVPTFMVLTFLLCPATPAASSQGLAAAATLPSFEAATIKPPDPKARFRRAGFYGEPGGRVFLGVNVKMLIQYAFDLQEFQVAGGPGWVASQQFDISAVPPETSITRNIAVANAEPTPEQRLMLQRLLRDRFGFQFHLAAKQGEVYLLTRGTRPLELQPPKDPASDPRALVYIRQGGIADGEAMGNNTTLDYLAKRFTRYLQLPVLNQTGIAGSYDFHLAPEDPDNQDIAVAVFKAADRLGLKIKRSPGTIQTLVIDHVEQPSEN
jgi:uncharacterized protein (TIGR03435 family)